MSYQCGQGHQTMQNETLKDPRISQLMRKKYIPLLKGSKKFLGNRLRKCKKKKKNIPRDFWLIALELNKGQLNHIYAFLSFFLNLQTSGGKFM